MKVFTIIMNIHECLARMLFVSCLTFFIVGCIYEKSLYESKTHDSFLFINEFMASNDTQNTDEYGEYDDWVEIFNGGTTTVDLGGYFISDDHEIPVQIPTGAPGKTMVEPGGFILLWFDNTPEQGPLHIAYKLSSAGDAIHLYDVDGVTRMDSYSFSHQTTDVSEGRESDGDEKWIFFDLPTPGQSNR